MSKFIPTVFTLALLVFATAAQADVLGLYDFASSDFTSSDGDGNSTASDLVAGNTALGVSSIGTTHVDGASFILPVSSPAIAGEFGDIGSGLTTSTSLQDAIDNDFYHSFTITPLGPSIDFSSFSIDINKTSGGATVQVTPLLFARRYIHRWQRDRNHLHALRNQPHGHNYFQPDRAQRNVGDGIPRLRLHVRFDRQP
jgi:hypothetical protein